jgi:putative tryptophan/tyrosine transport system substrate-binding protein
MKKAAVPSTLVVVVLLAVAVIAEAQQPKKIPTIGFMRGGSPTDPEVEAFRQGLRELGYVEGKNIIIDFRNTGGKTDRFAGVAAELVRLKVDVIVAAGGSAVVLAAKPATDTILIVMTNPGDPVKIGVVASVARPGGNVTGLTTLTEELGGKQLELLKEIVAGLNRVAILRGTGLANDIFVKATEPTARALGVKIIPWCFGDRKISRTHFDLQRKSGPMVLSTGLGPRFLLPTVGGSWS